jgi:hypothetical protein
LLLSLIQALPMSVYAELAGVEHRADLAQEGVFAHPETARPRQPRRDSVRDQLIGVLAHVVPLVRLVRGGS